MAKKTQTNTPAAAFTGSSRKSIVRIPGISIGVQQRFATVRARLVDAVQQQQKESCENARAYGNEYEARHDTHVVDCWLSAPT